MWHQKMKPSHLFDIHKSNPVTFVPFLLKETKLLESFCFHSRKETNPKKTQLNAPIPL